LTVLSSCSVDEFVGVSGKVDAEDVCSGGVPVKRDDAIRYLPVAWIGDVDGELRTGAVANSASVAAASTSVLMGETPAPFFCDFQPGPVPSNALKSNRPARHKVLHPRDKNCQRGNYFKYDNLIFLEGMKNT